MKHGVNLAALLLAMSVLAVAASIKLVNNAATGRPGQFAEEEIQREAVARGMTCSDGVEATRIELAVSKEDKLPGTRA